MDSEFCAIRTEEQLRQLLPDMSWPAPHPEAGTVVSLDVRLHQDVEVVRFLEPQMPGRIKVTWDDDDIRHEQERTDEEFAQALATYERNLAEFRRSGGHHVIAGQRSVGGLFKTDRGCTARAIWANGEWHWTEWETR